jgi:hypothetical protein
MDMNSGGQPARAGGRLGQASYPTATADSAASTFQRGQEQMNAVVTNYPFSAVVTCFTAGLAVGITIGLIITEPPTPRWYERIPDSFGRRWLESLLNSLPESVRAQVR